MEEDIKILEAFKNQTFLYGRLAITQEAHKSISIAIENLIKGYRELEEKIHKEHTLGYSQGVYDCSEAWKETIKEKIEELEKDGIYQGNGYYCTGAKLVLHELMEE